MTTNNKRLHREDIKAEIRKKGVTLKDLSLANGLSASAVRNALDRPIPRADLVIAKFIDRKLHELWPDRYDQFDVRIKSSSNSCNKSKTKSALSHCKKYEGK